MCELGPLTRRELLRSAAVAAGTAALGAHGLAWAGPTGQEPKLPVRPFGKTGRSVSMLGLGTGQIAGSHKFDKAVEVVSHALDAGITYVDTAVSYRSEKIVGKAIAGRRDTLFLASKTEQRGYDGAMRELEQSLSLLGTDHLDLWQVHSIGRQRATGDEELVRLRKENSVMKAMREQKEQGVVKLIGFTGHTNPDYMLQLLEVSDLEFDAMLFTLSAVLARRNQRDWEDRVLPAGRKKGLGLVAMKVFGAGQAVGKGESKASPAELLSYVWDCGVAVANVGLNSKKEIDAAVAACKAYAEKKRPNEKPPAEGGGQPPADGWALRERFRNATLSFEQPDYCDEWRGRVV
jgi:aryl-alcohol dehydrogenase-like predicted oxidoreductase